MSWATSSEPHGPYVATVAAVLEADGLPVLDAYAEDNDPATAAIELAFERAVHTSRFAGCESLTLGWDEEAGWCLDVQRPGSAVAYWSDIAVVAQPYEVIAWLRGLLDGSGERIVQRPRQRREGDDDEFEDDLAVWAKRASESADA